jgi:hypothetical protein
MTPVAPMTSPPVHTGQCRTVRGAGLERPDRGYCLHDTTGQPVGTIAAPATRPVLGRSAPTFYLRRA